MERIIYVIGVLAVLTGVAITRDIPTPAKISIGGALLIFADIVYGYFYG